MNPSEKIDKQVDSLSDWQKEMYVDLRKIINAVDPALKEEWKWNTAVWTKNGLICALGVFKNHLKINVFRGAELTDPDKLFNAGLDAKTMRSIDFHDGDAINELGLQKLIRSAVALNSKPMVNHTKRH